MEMFEVCLADMAQGRPAACADKDFGCAALRRVLRYVLVTTGERIDNCYQCEHLGSVRLSCV